LNFEEILIEYVGETGENESAVETLQRLIKELEGYRTEKKLLVEGLVTDTSDDI
jgi:hypothetical protein